MTAGRVPIFNDPRARSLLREAIGATRRERPFELDAVVLLPDHLHVVCTLPGNDADFSTRLAAIKARFSRAWLNAGGAEQPVAPGRANKGGRGVWQERFWEHAIRDDGDLNRHLDYVHYNPVKHGLVGCPHQWPWSSFRRWMAAKAYEADWQCGCGGPVVHPAEFGWAEGLEME